MRPDRYIAGTFPAGEERRFAADYAARLGVSTGIGTNRQAMRDTASEVSTSVIRASSHPSAFERS